MQATDDIRELNTLIQKYSKYEHFGLNTIGMQNFGFQVEHSKDAIFSIYYILIGVKYNLLLLGVYENELEYWIELLNHKREIR